MDAVPTELEVAFVVAFETICMNEPMLDEEPTETLVIDTFEYGEFADGLPDHLISISNLLDPLSSREANLSHFCQLSKPTCTTKAFMKDLPTRWGSMTM